MRIWSIVILTALAVGQVHAQGGPQTPPASVPSYLPPPFERPVQAAAPSLPPVPLPAVVPAPAVQQKEPVAVTEQPKSAPPRDAALPFLGSKQDTGVTVEWAGPSVTQVGQRSEYSVVVRNGFPAAVHKVAVNVRMPAGMAITGSKPPAASEGEIAVWQLGTLQPRQERVVQMQAVVNVRGDVTPQAWVTFTGNAAASLRIHARELKLAVKVTAPARVVAGDPANVTVTVTNPGDSVAARVKVSTTLSDGLENARGKKTDFEIGDLAAGESRAVQLVCIAKTGGEQKCDVVAESGGCIKARESCAVTVVAPRLEVEMAGPTLRYVDRKAVYGVRVANRGEVPAINVSVVEAIPAGFKFVSATDGGHHTASDQTVSWFLGELAPGQSREIQFELLAVKAGEHRHRVKASSDRGYKVEVGRELTTRVEDLSALTLEIAHADDAIEVGKDTTYEVLVTNTGSKVETDIKLVCAVPEKMEVRSAQGPMRYHREGNVIIFEPVPRLAPRGDVLYQIKARASDPGDVRFKVQVTSTNLVEPVIKTEATRIYSDRP